MIRGAVNARREAEIEFRVIGPLGTADVSAVIDTGFTSFLTLPASTAATLGLVCTSRGTAVIADGSEKEFDVFAAEIEWDGVRRAVLISALGEDVLVGMGLLVGHELRMVVEPGGVVEIRRWP